MVVGLFGHSAGDSSYQHLWGRMVILRRVATASLRRYTGHPPVAQSVSWFSAADQPLQRVQVAPGRHRVVDGRFQDEPAFPRSLGCCNHAAEGIQRDVASADVGVAIDAEAERSLGNR